MKNKINVLMVDDNKNAIRTVREYFSKHAVINLNLEAHDGEEATNLIFNHESEYDVILLDLIIPKIDGMTILEEMKARGMEKKVIVLTSYKKEETVKKAGELGISYYMMKPFSNETLERRILEIADNKEFKEDPIKNNLQIDISKLLHSLGVPSHIKGYQYIRESVFLMYAKPDMLGGITKELYPEVAVKFDTTASRVERAIRHAIEVSWTRGDYNLMEEIFGHSVDYDRSKPTNSEFIVTLADKLRLEKIYTYA